MTARCTQGTGQPLPGRARDGERARPHGPPRPAGRRVCGLASLASLAVLCLAGLAGAAESNRLRPGDLLSITVYNHQELDVTVRVGGDGRIAFPLVGELQAGGLDVSALTAALDTRLGESNIADPHVTVLVTQYAPRRVYVLGELGKGGLALDLPPDGRVTAMQAISEAGGFKETADLRSVAVLRTDGKGGNVRLPVDAVGLLQSASREGDIDLEPGDTVMVPRAPPVTVLGAVGRPGTVQLDTARTTTCSELLGLCGDLRDNADRRQAVILRKPAEAGAAPQALPVDLAGVLAGDVAKDLAVLPGDRLVIQHEDQVFVLGEVRNPGPVELAPGVTMTVMRAIAAAGGFTKTAKESDVQLIRGGKMQRLDVRRALAAGGDGKQDAVLEPGDMIVVQESVW